MNSHPAIVNVALLSAENRMSNLSPVSNSINVDINKINEIINDCLSEHLFNKFIHKKFNIINSKGIQERYFEAIDRRKEAEIIKEYIVLKNEYINKLNVNINWLNVDKSTQSKVDKSKEKESKDINKDKEKIRLSKIPNFEEFKNFTLEQEPKIDLKELKQKYESWKINNWKDGNDKDIKNWKSKVLSNLKFWSLTTGKNNYSSGNSAKKPYRNSDTETYTDTI